MRRRPGIYKRGDIYWITYTWQGRQYFESSHSSDMHDAEALLLRRRSELDAGRVPVRISQTMTVDLSGHPKPANEGHLKTGQRE